ncbi:MAG TPA: carbohydrate kinase family protein [Anaerolineae bacterium]|nr:carbohydrate kinase family protein [Anaerolineae bacterium]
MNIVVTGSIAYDYIMSFPGYFKEHVLADKVAESINLSFLVDRMVRRRGGVGSNIAYTLALLGERPLLMGAAGQDFDEYRTWLESHGVDTSAVRQYADLFTASFFCNIDLAQNQIASFYSGAMSRARELSFYDLGGGPIDLAIVSPTDPEAMQRCVRECKEIGIPYLYDVSWQIVRLSDDDLREGITGSYVLIVNEYEFAMIRNRTRWDEGDILERAETLIVTRGEHGSTIYRRDGVIHVSAVAPERAIDPIGVGDGYRAGLLKGLAVGLGWESAGRIASLAATYVLESDGPQGHSYTLPEFVERFRKHFDDAVAIERLRERVA